MNSLKLFLFFYFQLNALWIVAATVDGRWTLGIGDPTLGGWLTVACYFVALTLAWRQYPIVQKRGIRRESVFWIILMGILLFLGINKQLDLQSWFTEVMRDLAIEHGWYAERRKVQFAFLGILLLSGMIALITLRLYLVKLWETYNWIWAGLTILGLFVFMRAVSFHYFDIWIHTNILGITMNVMMEIGALLVVIVGILRANSVRQKITQDVLVIPNIETPVACPRCGCPPVSHVADGRKFKCKDCGFKYTVHIKN